MNLAAKSQIGIDEPASFRLLEPASLEEAARMLEEHGTGAALLAGGCDLLEKIKTQWIRPEVVVNLKTVRGLDKVSAGEIGALATLARVAREPGSGEPESGEPALPAALRQAAAKVATPQIRNVGTLGGNLLQDSRCPYYRGPWHCYRAGGITCDAVRGFTYEHALWGGERCYTVSPSDTAPALVALGAEAEVFGKDGKLRVMPIEKLFALPSYDITSMHTLAHGEILTRIRLPAARPGARSAFRKAAMRESWDFALASAAVYVEMEGEVCREARVVLGAVAPVPWRAREAENALRRGKLKDRLEDAARAAVAGAEPLPHNGYKIGLVKGLVREALQEIAGSA
jgi:xanthine dehydrogenase YagS FAD-binding subunit